MSTITFKAKPRTVYNADDTVSHTVIMVPEFKRSHCDMESFRKHPKYRGLANSDLFPNVLSRIRRDRFNGRDYFRLDAIPIGVTVDTSGFLAIVTLDA